MRCSESPIPIRPHFVAFVWPYHARDVRFVPPVGPHRPSDRPGVFSAGCPLPALGVEETGPPRFLGEPLRPCPALGPRWNRKHQAIYGAAMLPSGPSTPSASTTINFRGSVTRPRSLAVYASQHGLPLYHARLASGCWPGFTGQPKSDRWVPFERFQPSMSCGFLLSQASPGARMGVSGPTALAIASESKRAEPGMCSLLRPRSLRCRSVGTAYLQ